MGFPRVLPLAAAMASSLRSHPSGLSLPDAFSSFRDCRTGDLLLSSNVVANYTRKPALSDYIYRADLQAAAAGFDDLFLTVLFSCMVTRGGGAFNSLLKS